MGTKGRKSIRRNPYCSHIVPLLFPRLGRKSTRHGRYLSVEQGCDVTVLAACEQIALPMTGDGAVLNLCGPLANGDGIDDLTLGVPCSSSMHGAADESLRSKMLNQLLFQHSSSLDE